MQPAREVTSQDLPKQLLPQELSFLQQDSVQLTMQHLCPNSNLLNTTYAGGQTFFMLVLQAQARKTAMHLLHNRPKDLQLDACDDAGKSALHYAAAIADPSLFSLLIEKGVGSGRHPITFEEGKTSLLHLAAESREPYFEILISALTTVDMLDENGMTPLCRAVRAGLEFNTRLLLQKGAKTDCGTPVPLVEAYLNKKLTCAQILLVSGANPTATYLGTNLLDLAEVTDYQDFVELLSKFGASSDTFEYIQKANELLLSKPDATLGPHYAQNMTLDEFLGRHKHLEKANDSEDNLHLHTLAVSCPSEIVKSRDIKRGDWQKQNALGQTPFLYACRFGNLNCLVELTRANKHQSICDSNNDTALHLMSSNPNSNVHPILIDALKSCIETTNKQGYTPLLLAISKSRFDIAQALLQSRANPSVVDSNQNTILHLLSDADTTDVIAIEKCIKFIKEMSPSLLEKPNAQGDTPLHYAVRKKKSAVINALLNIAVHVDRVNLEGQTPFLLSLSASHDITWRLINAGARRRTQNNQALLEACRRVHEKAVEYLVAMQVENSKPADPNKRSQDKSICPLSVIVKAISDQKLNEETLRESPAYRICKLLIANGADPKKKLKRPSGKITIVEYAKDLKVPGSLLTELQGSPRSWNSTTGNPASDHFSSAARSLSSESITSTSSSSNSAGPSPRRLETQSPSPRQQELPAFIDRMRSLSFGGPQSSDP